MEYEHAKVYANIQMMRFSDRIKVFFDDLPEDLKLLVVPRLILQPIIENSFKYGLEDMAENAILSIKIFREQDQIRIEAEDNGRGMDDSNINELNKWLNTSDNSIETTGIINIHKRLQLFFGMESGIRISKSSMGGLKVVLMICGKNIY